MLTHLSQVCLAFQSRRTHAAMPSLFPAPPAPSHRPRCHCESSWGSALSDPALLTGLRGCSVSGVTAHTHLSNRSANPTVCSLFHRKQLYQCPTLNFGACASGFYWARLAGMLSRLLHRLISFRSCPVPPPRFGLPSCASCFFSSAFL